MPFDHLSAISRIPALTLSNVTDKCISTLGILPFTRAKEGFSVPPWISTFTDKIFLQDISRPYSSDDILNTALDSVVVKFESLRPDYWVKIYQIDKAPSQLLLVAVPNDLEIDPANKYPRSLPFLIYIHPSPQDTFEDHREIFEKKDPALYRGVPDNEIPLFYKDLRGFPFVWDFLFFQFLMNITGTGLPAQLKKADKPFVLVIPMVKSLHEGMGILNSAKSLEQCLLGVELEVFNERISVLDGVLPEVEWVSFAAFSIGNEILNGFVRSNGNSSFVQQKIREYILFDPPPNNPANRSNIVLSLVPPVTAPGKHILLYGEDPWYFGPLLRLISQKGIRFDLTTEKIFDNKCSDPSVFLAFLKKSDLKVAAASLLADNPHSVFPSLFMKDAARRTCLHFVPVGLKKHPDY